MISRTMARTNSVPVLFQPSLIGSLRAIALDWLVDQYYITGTQCDTLAFVMPPCFHACIFDWQAPIQIEWMGIWPL
jgi:hypothetical protein